MLTKRDLLRSAAMAALAATMATVHPGHGAGQGRMAQPAGGQGHRRGRLHLRPAAGDELRGHAGVRRRQELRAVQGAVQRDQQHAPRRHPRGHGGHHAEQRHALFDLLAGSARRADGDLGPGGGKGALLLRAAHRRQHLQLWLHRQPRHGHRGRRLSRRRPRLERRDAGGDQARSSPRPRRSRSPLFRTQLFNPDDMPNVEKVQAGYKVQPLSAFLKQPAPPAAPKIDFLPATTAGIKDELLRVSRRRAAVRARDAAATRRSAPNWRPSASGRARPSTSRTSRSNTRPPSCSG